MKLGRWRAAVLAGATAVIAAVLGLGGIGAAVATSAVPSSQVQTGDAPPACGTTNGEYAQAPPDCDGTGPVTSIQTGGVEVVDTIDLGSLPAES